MCERDIKRDREGGETERDKRERTTEREKERERKKEREKRI